MLHGHVHRQYLEVLGRLEVKEYEEEASGEGGFWWASWS